MQWAEFFGSVSAEEARTVELEVPRVPGEDARRKADKDRAKATRERIAGDLEAVRAAAAAAIEAHPEHDRATVQVQGNEHSAQITLSWE